MENTQQNTQDIRICVIFVSSNVDFSLKLGNEMLQKGVHLITRWPFSKKAQSLKALWSQPICNKNQKAHKSKKHIIREPVN